MECSDTPNLIDPFIDGELDPGHSVEVNAHLRHCDDCTQAVEAHRALSRAIRTSAPRYEAPQRLRSGIAAAIAAELAGERSGGVQTATVPENASAAAPLHPAAPAPRSQQSYWRPLALAASLVLAIASSSGVTAYLQHANDQDRIVQDVVSGHIRSLMADHLTDVLSSDQHTVKPWFNGKIDLSPPVDDLAANGFPLIGGRIDYLEQRPVAALVYRHRQHPINLFVLPAATARGGSSDTYAERGYNVLHWSEGDMSLWAVSDLNLTELKEFRQLYETHGKPPGS